MSLSVLDSVRRLKLFYTILAMIPCPKYEKPTQRLKLRNAFAQNLICYRYFSSLQVDLSFCKFTFRVVAIILLWPVCSKLAFSLSFMFSATLCTTIFLEFFFTTFLSFFQILILFLFSFRMTFALFYITLFIYLQFFIRPSIFNYFVNWCLLFLWEIYNNVCTSGLKKPKSF